MENSEMTLEKSSKKLPTRAVVGLVFLILGVIVTVLSFVFATEIFGKETLADDGATVIVTGSVFDKPISNNAFINSVYSKWIPALIRNVRAVTIAVLLSLVVRFVMRKSFARTRRGITVTKLLESFVKWVVAIVSVLLILSAWGVNTAALVASAGVLTLVIGLGAQSLVADVVAGLFIVFEGDIEVGDIVIINDWRGTVQSIGIRTTKLLDAGGNVNIINNSAITTIVNQTQAESLAKCTIGISYDESIERVEEVINANLPRMREEIPKLTSDIRYLGVNALSASSVDLLFVANCKEEDIYQVQRDMNRQLKLLFDANDITIPFPQVVVNPPSNKE